MLTRDNLSTIPAGLLENNRLVFVEWCTGLGKTRAAAECIKKFLLKQLTEFIIFVPRIELINSWKIELLKWGVPEYRVKDIPIVCYASMANYKDHLLDLIILDEAHHAGTDLKLELLEHMCTRSTYTKTKVLCLSATLDKSFKEEMESFLTPSRTSHVSLETAIANKLLAVPKIHLIPLTLENTRNSETYVYTRGKEKSRTTVMTFYYNYLEYVKKKDIYPDLELQVSCTEKQRYSIYCDFIEYLKNKTQVSHSKADRDRWLLECSKRKRFLANKKTTLIKNVLKADFISSKRYLCFVATIAQALTLGGDSAIHSRLSEKQIETMLNDFNDHKSNKIYAVGKLIEGVNLKDLEAVIIGQLDGKERLFIQKVGRAMRSDSPEIYVFYFKDTRDEAYLNQALEGINKDYIDTISLDTLCNSQLTQQSQETEV